MISKHIFTFSEKNSEIYLGISILIRKPGRLSMPGIVKISGGTDVCGILLNFRKKGILTTGTVSTKYFPLTRVIPKTSNFPKKPKNRMKKQKK